ncbi:MAG: co-chaperone GroES [Patescibacteria group bacterium]
MKIKPLNDRVLLEAVKEERKKGGIILPETIEKERPQEAIVIAVGPGKWDEDGKKRISMTIKKGDKVLFTKYGPNEIKVDDKEYLIAREDDIMAIIE